MMFLSVKYALKLVVASALALFFLVDKGVAFDLSTIKTASNRKKVAADSLHKVESRNSHGMPREKATGSGMSRNTNSIPQQNADILRDEASLAYARDDLQTAHDRAQEALFIYYQSGNLGGQAACLSILGSINTRLGNYRNSIDYHHKALGLWRELGAREGEAKSTNNIGVAYASWGEYSQALTYYKKALVIIRELRDRKGEGRTLTNIGVTYEILGLYHDALESHNQALEIVRGIKDKEGEGFVLSNIGGVYKKLGQFKSALKNQEDALAIWRELNNTLQKCIALTHIGITYDSMGNSTQALAHLNEALELSRSLRIPINEAKILTNIGVVHNRLSQYQDAMSHHQQAMAIAQRTDDRLVQAVIINNIGVTHRDFAAYPLAISQFLKALEISRALRDRRGEAIALNNLGESHQYLGRYKESLGYFSQALEIHRSIKSRDGEGISLSNLGALYYRFGQYSKSEETLNSALKIVQETGSRSAEASILGSLGEVASVMRKTELAKAHFRNALYIARELNYVAAEVEILGGMGVLNFSTGNLQQALYDFQQAQKLAEKISLRRYLGITLNNLGVVNHGLRMYSDARDSFNRSLAIARQDKDQLLIGMSLLNLGVIEENDGHLDRAMGLFKQSIEVKESVWGRIHVDDYKITLAGLAADVYKRAALLHYRLRQNQEAFDVTEQARARAFLDQISNPRLELRKGADPKSIRQEQQLRHELSALWLTFRKERSKPIPPGSTVDSENIRNLTRQISNKQREYEGLLITLRLNAPEYASLVGASPLKCPQIQRLLDKDVTLISYFVTPVTTIAFVITKDSIEVENLKVDEQNLRDIIIRLRDFPSTDEIPKDTLQQLYSWLISPIKHHIKTPYLGIIPNDALHYLPFAMLIDGERYFGDEYKLFYLPSASTLKYIKEKRKAGPNRLFAIAQSRAEGFSVLKYADQEAKNVATIYGTRAVTGSAATESEFRLRSTSHNLLLIAAHGQLDPDNPLFSALILGTGKEHDGRLEVHEVYDLDLAKADIVALSACETQVGKRSNGDDILGLSRAFIYAGAPTVIASLWKVNDQSTVKLMTSFFTYLRKGMNKSAALQQAQAEVRKIYPHPYHWAAFVLVGDIGMRVKR